MNLKVKHNAMKVTRKAVDLNAQTIGQLTTLCMNDGQQLKPFIEAQLIAMGERGVSYQELWDTYESLAKELAMLANQQS